MSHNIYSYCWQILQMHPFPDQEVSVLLNSLTVFAFVILGFKEFHKLIQRYKVVAVPLELVFIVGKMRAFCLRKLVFKLFLVNKLFIKVGFSEFRDLNTSINSECRFFTWIVSLLSRVTSSVIVVLLFWYKTFMALLCVLLIRLFKVLEVNIHTSGQ